MTDAERVERLEAMCDRLAEQAAEVPLLKTTNDKLQARLDAALDALAECRGKRNYYREQAREWKDHYYRALRGEHVHDVPVDREGPDDQ